LHCLYVQFIFVLGLFSFSQVHANFFRCLFLGLGDFIVHWIVQFCFVFFSQLVQLFWFFFPPLVHFFKFFFPHVHVNRGFLWSFNILHFNPKLHFSPWLRRHDISYFSLIILRIWCNYSSLYFSLLILFLKIVILIFNN